VVKLFFKSGGMLHASNTEPFKRRACIEPDGS
jgi:hypothetical protein